jgi:hypothetical protein
LHLRFKGVISTTQSYLAKGVDTIGDTGGVILPPSIVDGIEYEPVNDIEPAELPTSIAERIQRAKSHHAAATDQLDLPVNVSRAIQHLDACVQKGKVAIEGEAGNATTYQVAAELGDLGLSLPKVMDLMWELWNPHCQPPWERVDLEFFVSNGLKYRQNEIGNRASTGSAVDIFGSAPEVQKELARSKAEGERPFLMRIDDLMKLPDPTELVEDFLIVGENVCFFGEPKKGKSTIALEVALSIAADVPVFGKLRVARPGAVVYLSGEGHSGMKKRIAVWLQERKISEPIPFFYRVGVPLTSKSMEECVEYVEGIRKFLNDKSPVLVVIDTMSRSMMGLDEDVANVTRYMDLTEGMKLALGCTILTLAHSGKDVERGIRGSNASTGMFDAVWSVERNENKIVKLESKWLKIVMTSGHSVSGSRP